MEFTLEALGLVIREHRLDVELTQEELGRAAGYGQGAGVSVSRIENGFTRPSDERLEGLAEQLGLTVQELQSKAENRTQKLASLADNNDLAGSPVGKERLEERYERIVQERKRRDEVGTPRVESYQAAVVRAHDDFFAPFGRIVGGMRGAPDPDLGQLDSLQVEDSGSAAALQLRLTSFGIATELASRPIDTADVAFRSASAGLNIGPVVGDAAESLAYKIAKVLGKASTDTPISELRGAAQDNAVRALFGGGSLDSGGSGVAGGDKLLAAFKLGGTLLVAAIGPVIAVLRSRKQRQALAAVLDELDAENNETRPGFEALKAVLPRATAVLDDISVHGGRALDRWARQIGPTPLDWESLKPSQQERYTGFVDVAACYLNLANLPLVALGEARGQDQERLIEQTNSIVDETRAAVDSHV